MNEPHVVSVAVRFLKSGAPCSGYDVAMWDLDLFFDDHLGTKSTDAEGRCEIAVLPEYYREYLFDRRPDVFFRVYKDGILVRDTRKEVICNLDAGPHEVVIDIEVDLDGVLTDAELERDDVVALYDLRDVTPALLRGSNPAIYQKLQSRALARLKASLDEALKTAPKALRAAARRIDLRALTIDGATVQQLLQHAIGKEKLTEEAREAALKAIATLSIPARLDDLLRSDVPLGQNLTFPKELDKSTGLRIARFARVDEKVVEELDARGLSVRMLSHEALQKLVDDGKVNEGAARGIGFGANLYHWLNGRFDLMEAFRSEARRLDPDGAMGLRALAGLSRADHLRVLRAQDQEAEQGSDGDRLERKANELADQIERLFPEDVVAQQLRPLDRQRLMTQLRVLGPLLPRNPTLFARRPAELDLSDVPADMRHEILSAHDGVARAVRRHGGLRLDAVLQDQRLNASQATAEVNRRVELLSTFRRLNPDAPLTKLDPIRNPGSVDALRFGNMSDDDRRMVISETTLANTMLAVASGRAEHAYRIKESYDSVVDIARETPSSLAATTGITMEMAERYRDQARAVLARTLPTIRPFILPTQPNPFHSPTSPEVLAVLARIPGLSVFGDQSHCGCKHCASIISPAAYFVDLMTFIESNISTSFGAGVGPYQALSLQRRRPDLWTLPLTCDNTHTLVPYLQIINEILENYVYAEEELVGAELPDREALEDAVYAHLYSTPAVQGFRQPFMFPLERLRLYLSHFSLTRAEIVDAVLDENASGTEIWAQAVLDCSEREYLLMRDAPDIASPEALAMTRERLRAVYAFPKPSRGGSVDLPLLADVVIPDFDAHSLLPEMGVSRDELAAVIATRFVTVPGLDIRPIPGTPTGQTDAEVVHGLTIAALDRMHRFTRLQRQIGWSIGELDLVLTQMDIVGARRDQSLPLETIATLVAIQRRFTISVEEICALAGLLPSIPTTSGHASLFDRRFNQQSEIWDPETLAVEFTHPAFLTTGQPTSAARTVHQRLLAGLKTDDESLLAILRATASATVRLDRSFLTLLYQQVRLAAMLRLSTPDLLQLQQLGGFPIERIADIAQLQARIRFFDWWRSTTYSLDELALLLRHPLRQPERFEDPIGVARAIVEEARQTRVLFFSETIFAQLSGVTEDQSRQIVEQNSATGGLLARANLHVYRINPGFDLASGPLSVEGFPGLTDEMLRERLGHAAAPGAPPFTETMLMGLKGVNEDNALALIEQNGDVFEAYQEEGLFTLMPAFFDPLNPRDLVISDDVPLAAEAARAHLLPFHISQVLPAILGRRLGIASDRVQAIVELGGWRLRAPEVVEPLVDELHGGRPRRLLDAMVTEVQRLSVLFEGSHLTSEILALVVANAGTGRLFPGFLPAMPSVDELTLDDVRAVALYASLIKENKSRDENGLRRIQDIHTALDAYDALAGRFRTDDADADADALAALARVFGADEGSVRALNQDARLLLPAADGGNPGNPHVALRGLSKLRRCVALTQRLGAGPDPVLSCAESSFEALDVAADALATAFRTKYDDDAEWTKKIEPYEDKLRERRRDALTDFILRTVAPLRFERSNDLYHWFLIDTQIQGCARTSRVVAGLSSLQLYVQRCLMHLEKSGDDVLTVEVNADVAAEWSWRKNYRVWEANRKVFLFPELLLLEELRDNKTELFREAEEGLRQGEMSADTALDVYAKYLDGFNEIAHLRIAGSYHDTERDQLHVFGVANTDPPQHYSRRVDNLNRSELSGTDARGVVWNGWEKVALKVPVRPVSPILFNGRLLLLWSRIDTKPRQPFNVNGYEHKISLYLSFKETRGAWIQPQQITNRGFTSVLEGFDLERRPSSDDAYVLRYSREQHASPREDYSLTGHRWNRLYPTVVGTDLFAKYIGSEPTAATKLLDVFESELKSLASWRGYSAVEFINQLGSTLVNAWGYFDTRSQFASVTEMSRGPGVSWQSEIITGAPPHSIVHLINSTTSTNPERPSITNAFVEVSNDTFLIMKRDAAPHETASFVLTRFGTTIADEMRRVLFEGGLELLMSSSKQRSLLEAPLPFRFNEDSTLGGRFNDAQAAIDRGRPDFEGSLGTYFREVFFHLPMLIAEILNGEGKFAEADRFLRYIMDPTAKLSLDGIAPEEHEQERRDRVWQYVEFRRQRLGTVWDRLNNQEAVELYRRDPFNPHAIARLDLGIYKRSVEAKFVVNLLDWGDDLFARDTTESINEATMLYVMAADLLGERPKQFGDCFPQGERDETYVGLMRASSSTVTMATETAVSFALTASPRSPGAIESTPAMTYPSHSLGRPASEDAASGHGPLLTDSVAGAFASGPGIGNEVLAPRLPKTTLVYSFATSLLSQAKSFCVPPSKDLLNLWDRVEDRLFKVRNCMNLSGRRRQLALFAPEIDPLLLVRARAAGLLIDDVLGGGTGSLPPYRFTFLIAKAKEFAGSVQSFGGALQAALEKRDAEELSRLRLTHERVIARLSTRLRSQEVEAREATLEALRIRRASLEHQREHWTGLLAEPINAWEGTQLASLKESADIQDVAQHLDIAAAAAGSGPKVLGTASSTGFEIVSFLLSMTASATKMLAGQKQSQATLSAILGANARQVENWQFNLEQTMHSLRESERQLVAEEIQLAIARRQLEIHEESIEHLQEVQDFYDEKFTGVKLYSWQARTCQRLFRTAFQDALVMARLAERAYRFERGDDGTALLSYDYWDGTRAGLLSGERLTADLVALERRYLETNYRAMEITQSFSLAAVDPDALIGLKQTGKCTFTLPELYFDLSYPGHWLRQIIAVRVTIPCITGPFTNLAATLTLNASQIRRKPSSEPQHLVAVPPTRSVTIATSSAQNDAGVFQLDFRDERYLPFEGMGAVNSEWTLEMPTAFQTIDRNTITDVILQISYTAEYSPEFRDEVEGTNGNVEGALSAALQETPLRRALSFRQELAPTLHRMMHAPAGTELTFEIQDRHFPFLLQGRSWDIFNVRLVLMPNQVGFHDHNDGEIRLPTIRLGDEEVVFEDNPNPDREPSYTDQLPIDNLDLRQGPVGFRVSITDSGTFGPPEGVSGSGALDPRKVRDLMLLMSYRPSAVRVP
jgi:hypothetical protein